MKNRVEKALEKKKNGYNCAQAVVCAFCDVLDVEENDLFRIMEGFGGGMGTMECVCGAVSGAVALTGLKNSIGCDNPTTKRETEAKAKEIVEKFKEMNGSVVCGELKGLVTKQPLRSCDGCVEDAVIVAEQLLFDEK
ncbi:MAG: C-GCAxxG-C-C family protein [Lachnospiraceae bacterium]